MMNQLATQIRAKKLGVLIRDARLSAHKTVQECAELLNISQADYDAIEMGEKSPSLPQLEVLAYTCSVPLDHFWENVLYSESKSTATTPDYTQLIQIRHKIIGVLLRQARIDSGMTLQEVADGLAISPSEMEAYELGETPLPLPLLEQASGLLNRPVLDFRDSQGPLGKKDVEQGIIQQVDQLPDEVQSFVLRPINRPYLELAMRLSEMSVDKLRAVAEGLLEITL